MPLYVQPSSTYIHMHKILYSQINWELLDNSTQYQLHVRTVHVQYVTFLLRSRKQKSPVI